MGNGYNAIVDTDPNGLKPGDNFSNSDAAVLDAMQHTQPASLKNNWEYGGVIYELNGEYISSIAVTKQHPSTVNPLEATVPKGASIISVWHTHAGVDKNFASDQFSTGDRLFAIGWDLPTYVIPLNNKMLQYNPWDLSADNFRKGETTILFDPLFNHQDAIYQSQQEVTSEIQSAKKP